MLKYTFKMASRYLLKDSAFTILNLIGLATGLACTILIYLWVNDELQVDKFNKMDSRLFRVLKNTQSVKGIVTDERTPGMLASTLAAEIPEVEYATSVIPVSWFDKKGLLIYGDHRITANEEFAGPDYFKMFSYRLIDGRQDQVLRDNQSIVISNELALKLFHSTEDVVGKNVGWNQKDYSGTYRISGVFQKPPANATARFDIVFNYSLFLEKNPHLRDWSYNDPSTFVVLKEDADIGSFNQKIAGLIQARDEKSTSTLWGQKYSDGYLHNHYENGFQHGGRIEYVRMFSGVAIFILVIACINFVNLSTAKAAGRIKETGIKKTIGASRLVLLVQYLQESLLLSALALFVALAMAFLLLPGFNEITGKQLSLDFTSSRVLAIMTIALGAGLLSGSYPALYLSGFGPAVILRSRIKSSASELFIRQGLVVFQFALSAIFIVSVLVIYRQMRLIQTKNLGYRRDNILYFDRGGTVSDNKSDYAPGGKYESSMQDFLQRIKGIPGVVNAANFRHNITNRDGGTYDISWTGKDRSSRIDFTDLDVGYDYIETAGITLKEGRTYSLRFANEKSNIIVNETAARIMGMKNPIGRVIHLWGMDRTIIGVVKDFNFQSLHENIKPCFFDLAVNQWASKILVRIQGEGQTQTIARLESLYKTYNHGETFDYRFLDQDYQALYSAETRVSALSKYFAGIAIIISCLGLLGLAAFTAQKRQRELGIRKVLGASATRVVWLLTKDFLILILLALLIAIPLSWWALSHWLNEFAFRVNLGIDIFLWTGTCIALTAILSISFQSLKAATVNPVKSLKSE